MPEHEEPPNPRNTGTGLPNVWGWLVIMAVNAAFIGLVAVVGLGFCQGCTHNETTRTGTLGGSYNATSDSNPLRTTTTETVTAPSAQAVESAMLSDAVRLCLAQRERQAELAVRRDASRSASQGGGFVAVVPPQHPSSVTDDYAFCMSLAQGQTSATALSHSTVPIPPTVVQNPWMTGYGGYGQFSGTGGAAGVR